MKMSRAGFALFIVAVCGMASGCAAMQAGHYAVMADRRPSSSALPGGPPAAATPPTGVAAEEVPKLSVIDVRKVVYTGEFNVVVSELAPAVTAAKKLAESMGGYVQRMTNNVAVIRVPADKFDQTTAGLDKIGTVASKNITSSDVTDQFTDLEIRIRNSKALLERMRALLTKAEDIKASLEIEKEIARLTNEVEALEGQMNRLQSQIALATLTVNFTAAAMAPASLKVNLPFIWLKGMGIEHVMNFDRRGPIFAGGMQ